MRSTAARIQGFIHPPTVMRDHYRLISETDIDKTYEMPKSFVSYRKPRILPVERKKALSEQMKRISKKNDEKMLDNIRV